MRGLAYDADDDEGLLRLEYNVISTKLVGVPLFDVAAEVDAGDWTIQGAHKAIDDYCKEDSAAKKNTSAAKQVLIIATTMTYSYNRLLSICSQIH